MGTIPLRFFSFLGTILIGLFLLFSGTSLVLAHTSEEGLTDPNPTLLELDVTEEESSHLHETSKRLVEFIEVEEQKWPSVESVSVEAIKNISLQFGVFGFLLLLLLVQFAFLYKNGSTYSKKLIFGTMVFVILIPTIYFITSTVYINVISVTKGPVHWHADFRIYACGEELLPPKPEGTLSNKTGTPVLHQHEDKRVHVEGVLVDKEDASLRNFFRVQGGDMGSRFIKIPTEAGFKTYTNGDTCPDRTSGVWNVFLYKTDVQLGKISKSKLIDFPNYVLSPHIEVPPGDCIIFEFGENTEDTDKICDFTQIDINKGNVIPTWIP